jgi:hypothetical protein
VERRELKTFFTEKSLLNVAEKRIDVKSVILIDAQQTTILPCFRTGRHSCNGDVI